MFTRSLFRTAANSMFFKKNNIFSTFALQRSFTTNQSNQTARRNHNHNHQHTNQKSTTQQKQITELDPNAKNIDLILRHNSVSLEIELDGTRKIYFINENFTFNILKEMIEFEYPSCSVEFDFTRSGSNLVDQDSNLFNFLRSDEMGEVIIEVDDEVFVLRNSGHSVLNQYLIQVEKESQENQGALHWFLQCQKNKIHPSHAGVLSHLISQFQQEVKNLKAAAKKDINLSETELDNIFIKTFKSFSAPVNQEIEAIQHQQNIIEQELSKLYDRRDNLFEAATKKSYFYLKLILLISLGHLATFYYMIFHVEWLGWDIIEPITYTVAQFSVLLAIRFFWKHKQIRSVENIIEIGRQRYLNQRVIKDIYSNLQEQIIQKEQQRDFLTKRAKILLNKKTYNTISIKDI
ncbi:transmembrane protein, putative (macronuclear) [Tetrahymena thermophila SB210]|uniref:Transmembrane protein, putative n=1 Tax=Tetrahymena thermophila (strain SB210) TaxID=312017 RepID=Q237B2_TETTS|nr:transmembrane protein, putative [Tetrahymena thermophila SB210]EAR92338.1 transmembrane protein, putative [Tetrahymena thermophila SB210]|eukprot:XP_001012583.1 transmembrane protein, putative [Tetrahymena thermophila SB210]